MFSFGSRDIGACTKRRLATLQPDSNIPILARLAVGVGKIVEGSHLVLHERNERRNDDCDATFHQRWQLKDQ